MFLQKKGPPLNWGRRFRPTFRIKLAWSKVVVPFLPMQYLNRCQFCSIVAYR